MVTGVLPETSVTDRCKCARACYQTDSGHHGHHSSSDTSSPHPSQLQILPKSSWYPRTMESRLKLQHGVLTSSRSGSGLRSRSQGWIHWLKVNKWALVLCGVLLMTGVAPFLCQQLITPDSPEEEDNLYYVRADQKLGRILRSLRAVHSEEERLQQRHLHAANTTTSKFSWLVQENALPNYFLGGADRLGSDTYKTSAIVFLHHHRAAGTAMTECLTQITQNGGQTGKVPTNWDSDSRALWDRKSKLNRLKRSNSAFVDSLDETDLHTGQYAFGVCEGYSSRKCSYFMLLRDPMERAVSSYFFCQQEGLQSAHEMCRAVDANDVSLRDWILLQGSTTFQQFVYNASWCEDTVSPTGSHSLGGSSVRVSPSRRWPCWLKQRVHVDQLPVSEREDLLDYVLEHLQAWFSVIGLVSELHKSAAMLEQVYGLPFTKCSNLMQPRLASSGLHDNRAYQNKLKKGHYDDNDPYYLQYDYFVKKALEADYKIYKKAVQIYKVQRQMVYNTL